jgi:hypothetical protein
MKSKERIEIDGGNTILTFLSDVRKGKYGLIEESSLPYARIKEVTLLNTEEEDYFYSIS